MGTPKEGKVCGGCEEQRKSRRRKKEKQRHSSTFNRIGPFSNRRILSILSSHLYPWPVHTRLRHQFMILYWSAAIQFFLDARKSLVVDTTYIAHAKKMGALCL